MDSEKIIQELRDTEHKSNAPDDYEIALGKAFRFLGFKAKTIGGKGDTDVLLTANIGQESYKVDVDGKTSKNEKIIESQINWYSLSDHKVKNKSDFVVVVGPDFAGGNLLKRAKENNVSLLTTSELIQIIEAHSKYPFTLLEIKDLFAEPGYLSEQVEDLLGQNSIRADFLKNFKTIIEEIQRLQNTSVGYFTFESLAGREKIQELDIELEDIQNIIQLLKIPFINAITEIDKEKFVLALEKKDLSNTFYQISNILITQKKQQKPLEPIEVEHSENDKDKEDNERKLGTKYYKWDYRKTSIHATAREENPYTHSCPQEHFKTILSKIKIAFENQNIINNDSIYQLLKDENLAPNRIFKGKSEEYKIRMTLGILELEDYIKWTGSLRPIEYTLNEEKKPIEIETFYQIATNKNQNVC